MPRNRTIAVIKKKGAETERPGAPLGNSNATVHGAWADLSRRNLDGRSKLARALRVIQGELVTALGCDPSPQEKILIDRVVYKLLRCALFEAADLAGKGNPSDPHYLALANSLRHDLQALGLERRQKQVLDLKEYLALRRGQQPGEGSTTGDTGGGT